MAMARANLPKILKFGATILFAASALVSASGLAGKGDPSLRWDALPCLTPAQAEYFRDALPALNLAQSPVTCGGSSARDHFLRLLNYTASIRIDQAALAPSVRAVHPAFAADNPSLVLIARFAGLSAIRFEDLTNFRTVIHAGYSPEQNALYFGSSFFRKSPLEAMLTLFHESQHIDPNTPAHVICNHGRDFGTYCDQTLDLGQSMGSYSFEVTYALGLAMAATNLSETAKEILREYALDRLASNFNRIDSRFALEQDLLVVADPQGYLWQYSPWLGKFLPFPMGANPIPLRKIETGIFRRSDFSLLGAGGDFFALISGDAHRRETIQFSAPHAQWQSLDLMRHRNKYGRSFLNDRNELFFQTGFSNNAFQLEQIPLQTDTTLVKQFMRGNGATILLGANGNLYAEEQGRLEALPALQDPEGSGWRDASAGYFRNSVLGLNHRGNLFFFNESGKWQLSRYSRGNAPGATTMNKIKEGRSSLVQWDGQSQIYWSSFAQNATRELRLGFPIVDVAILSRVKPHSGIGRAATVSPDFFKNCGIRYWAQDPWTWLGIGINHEGKLVFERRSHDAKDLRSQCEVTENSGNQKVSVDRTAGYPRLRLDKRDGSVAFIQ